MVVGFTATYAYAPITTSVVSSNPAQTKCTRKTVCMQFVSDLRQVGGFSPGTPVSSTNKIDHHDTTECLLKVALNTIAVTPIVLCKSE